LRKRRLVRVFGKRGPEVKRARKRNSLSEGRGNRSGGVSEASSVGRGPSIPIKKKEGGAGPEGSPEKEKKGISLIALKPSETLATRGGPSAYK